MLHGSKNFLARSVFDGTGNECHCGKRRRSLRCRNGFFAFSGGQESDQGLFNDRPVVNARKEEGEIYYQLEPDHGLAIGDHVMMKIDWARRFRLMRLHFAAELVLELAYRDLPGVHKIGAHISEEKARIDFEWSESIAPELPNFERDVREIVFSDRQINCDFSDQDNEHRFWKIDGFSEVPCGGTHVRSTREVGAVSLKRKNPGKGKERIEIYLTNFRTHLRHP